METEKKYLAGWWFWILFLLVVSGVVLSILSYAGLFGKVFVERKVFENSYQYSEARKSAISTFSAQLAEIDRKLSNQNLDQNTRANLEAQAASIRIQLSTERRK